MKNFKKQYRDLEKSVISELKDRVENSNYFSKHYDEKAIKVHLFDYVELAIINDELTFLDPVGYQYSLYGEASLEDLIDILTKKKAIR